MRKSSLESKPLISFICPFKNEIAVLQEALDSFVHQTYWPIEVILVDSDSTDGSTQIAQLYAEKYPFVKYYNFPSVPGKWATRFYVKGMEFAKGDYIYMADANAKLASFDYITLCMKHFQDDTVAGVVGKVRIWDTSSWIPRFRYVLWKLRYDNVDRMRKEVSQGKILPRLFSRKAFDAVGGFREDAGWAVDTFFNKALLSQGYTLVYEPKAVWYHQWRDKPVQLMKYSYTFGRLNIDLELTDIKHVIKNIFFLLFPLFLLLGVFSVQFLFLALLHVILLFLKYLLLFFRASGVQYRWYSFAGVLVSYLQGLPHSFGFLVGLFSRR